MALLDVSEVLTDPDLADSFIVNRRAESVNQNGRMTMNVQPFEAVGVVCAASPNDLKRLPEDQRTQRAISVTTTFRLRASAPGYQPDLVLWDGNFFIVADLQPYTNYGAGFVQAICIAQEHQDQPPSEAGGVAPVAGDYLLLDDDETLDISE